MANCSIYWKRSIWNLQKIIFLIVDLCIWIRPYTKLRTLKEFLFSFLRAKISHRLRLLFPKLILVICCVIALHTIDPWNYQKRVNEIRRKERNFKSDASQQESVFFAYCILRCSTVLFVVDVIHCKCFITFMYDQSKVLAVDEINVKSNAEKI